MYWSAHVLPSGVTINMHYPGTKISGAPSYSAATRYPPPPTPPPPLNLTLTLTLAHPPRLPPRLPTPHVKVHALYMAYESFTKQTLPSASRISILPDPSRKLRAPITHSISPRGVFFLPVGPSEWGAPSSEARNATKKATKTAEEKDTLAGRDNSTPRWHWRAAVGV
jgi:hypothetical protein